MKKLIVSLLMFAVIGIMSVSAQTVFGKWKTIDDETGLEKSIVEVYQKDGDDYSGGTILDPENGKIYKCYISLEEPNKLKVRGFIGFALIGRTQYWHRVTE